MLEEYIEKLRPYVLELFKNDSSGHDISHLERTMRIALKLQEIEGGDRLIIGIAAFLHDIHRIMQNESGIFVSPKDSLGKVREILSNVDLTEEQVNSICLAIEYHEEYNWNGNNIDDINTLILQDADNLEALGAIGIARVIIMGNKMGEPLYDDKIPINEDDDFIEGNSDLSSIHHFYHKIFKLKDNMNTETARKMAEQRTDFMREFVKQFLEEWHGNK